MAVSIKPLTKAQLVGYFETYRNAFPDWNVEYDVVLARTLGPLKQTIAFQSLRSGAYRSSCAVGILLRIPDGCGILQQHLDVKHREVLPREHRIKWPLVLKAMEEQFLPAIRKPLDVADALRCAEAEAERDRIENTNYITGLAALNAYVGNASRALHWCDHVEERMKHLGREPAEWESRKRDFARELKQAIEAGRHFEFLKLP